MPRSAYWWHARGLPAALVALPVALLAFHASHAGAITLVPVLTVSAVILLGANVLRDLGKRYEQRLFARHGGLPTTRSLRLRGQKKAVVRARRQVIEDLSGRKLPKREREDLDPIGADQAIEEAVLLALERLRRADSTGMVLKSEERDYGFRRNLRGAKWAALAITIVATAANVLLSLATGAYGAGVTIAVVQVAWSLVLVLVVTDRWVLTQADRFAERFFIAALTP